LARSSERSAPAAGFTQEDLAAIAGLSVHAVSALERGERRRPHVDTVRALSAALDLNVRARLGPDRWGRAYAAGRAVSIEALIQEVNATVSGRARG